MKGACSPLYWLFSEQHCLEVLQGYLLEPWHVHVSRETTFNEGNGTPLQYSCLENPMDRGAWQATDRGVAKSWTRLSDFHSLTRCHVMTLFAALNNLVISVYLSKEDNGTPLQYSCLENPMDGGAW